MQSCAVATNVVLGDGAVAGFSGPAVGSEDDCLTGRPAGGVEAVTPVFGTAPTGLPLSVPVSLAGSGAIGADGGDAAVVAGPVGDTLGRSGGDSLFDRNHVAVAMNPSNSPAAIMAPIADGRDHLLEATGRDSSYDGRSGGTSSRPIGGAPRSSAMTASLGSTLRLTSGALIGVVIGGALIGALTEDAAGGSTALPRAAQKSSRFFRLVATKG